MQYMCQLFAKAGVACLAMDPLGEEERHDEGKVGTRAHDKDECDQRSVAAGRLIMGKFVLDTSRGIDFLEQRGGIDLSRIGVAGNSLGGAAAGFMVALEPRLRMAIISGWGYDDAITGRDKFCQRRPHARVRERVDWAGFLALGASHCATLVMNGDADDVVYKDDPAIWDTTRRVVAEAGDIYEALGASRDRIQAWFEPGGGHRPYPAHKDGLRWVHHHLGTPAMSADELEALPEINFGQWLETYGYRLSDFYNKPRHYPGATVADRAIQPLPREQLAVLHPDEAGDPRYTLGGWLDLIERRVGRPD